MKEKKPDKEILRKQRRIAEKLGVPEIEDHMFCLRPRPSHAQTATTIREALGVAGIRQRSLRVSLSLTLADRIMRDHGLSRN